MESHGETGEARSATQDSPTPAIWSFQGCVIDWRDACLKLERF